MLQNNLIFLALIGYATVLFFLTFLVNLQFSGSILHHQNAWFQQVLITMRTMEYYRQKISFFHYFITLAV